MDLQIVGLQSDGKQTALFDSQVRWRRKCWKQNGEEQKHVEASLMEVEISESEDEDEEVARQLNESGSKKGPKKKLKVKACEAQAIKERRAGKK